MHGNDPRLSTDTWHDIEGSIEMATAQDEAHEEDQAATAPLIDTTTEHPNHDDAQYESNGNRFIWLLTFAACVGGLLFGYDTGVISSTLVSIGTDLSNRTLTSTDKGLITASTSFFALIASPFAGLLADKIGRKKIIIYSDALFTVGALWQAFSSSIWAMIVGRSIVGLAIGAASMIVPLYIAELAPSSLRGRLTTVQLLLITGGQAVAYIVGWGFSTVPQGWRWMVGLGGLPAIVQMIMLAFMPETPRFLVRDGKEQTARHVLENVYGKRQFTDESHNQSETLVNRAEHQVEKTLLAIKEEMKREEEAAMAVENSSSHSSRLPARLSSLLFHPPHARALTIACLLQGLQQACGFNSLMYFSATIFSLIGFTNPVMTSLTVALTNFVFTILAFYLIDRLGRRKSLLYTIPVMVLSLLLAATMFRFVKISIDGNNSSTGSQTELPHYIILLALMLYVSSYATGLGPVPWQQSELFPLSVRSLGSSLSTATNWGLNTIVGLTFLPMMQVFTPTGTFVLYAMICCAGLVAVWWCYPETMGLEIEEIGGLLQNGWGVKESVERLRYMKRKSRR